MIVDFLYDFWVNHDIMYDHSLALFSFEQVIALIRDGKKNREKKTQKKLHGRVHDSPLSFVLGRDYCLVLL